MFRLAICSNTTPASLDLYEEHTVHIIRYVATNPRINNWLSLLHFSRVEEFSIEKLKQAATVLSGDRDFSLFSTPCNEGEYYDILRRVVRTVHVEVKESNSHPLTRYSQLTENCQYVDVMFTGPGFLYHQVSG